MNAHPHIFISYARRDGSRYAEALETNLQTRGFRTWRDTRGIRPEKDFTAIIEKAIESSSHVVACITRDSKRDDGFVRREIQYALMEGKPVLPARFDNITPHVHIVTNTFIDFFQDESTALEQLCNTLNTEATDYIEPTFDAGTHDPFHPYLETLYKRIVNFLDRAVINLVDLSAESTPDAVQKQVVQSDMMLEFFAAHGLDDTAEVEQFEFFKDAFERYDGRLLLLGDPGAGKTITLMAHARDAVVRRMNDLNAPLPLLGLIPTWDYNNKPDFDEWIASGFRELDTAEVRDVVRQQRALFLLDGLDELGLERIETVEEEVKKDGEQTIIEGEDLIIDPRYEFMSRIPQDNQVLVTSRVKDYFDIGDRIQLNGAVTLQPLTHGHLQDYLKDQPDLLAAVNADEALRNMLSTPLILSLFAFAYLDKGDDAKRLRNLKDSPSALRNEIIETYINKRYQWEQRKHPLALTIDDLYNQLGIIAMRNAGSIEESNVLTTDDFTMVDDVVDYDTVIEIATRLHILIPDGNANYRFIHLTIRDHFGYAYALRHLTDEDYYDDETQPNPARALGRIGDTRALPQLIEQLNSHQHILRLNAIEALGELKSIDGVTPLIEQLHDADWRIRDYATRALIQIGTPAVEPLLDLFPIEDDKQFAYHMATALKRIRDGLIPGVDEPLADDVLAQIANIVERHGQVIALNETDVSHGQLRLRWVDPSTPQFEQSYILIEGATVTIGRSIENDIQISTRLLSRQHSVITYTDGMPMIQDLGSSNGTFVNGKRLESYHMFHLVAGDLIQYGDIEIQVEHILPSENRKSKPIISGGGTTLYQQKTSRLIVTSGPQEGQTIPLLLDELTIGRATANATWEIILQDPSVSRPHARLVKRDNIWHVIDLGSSNGTMLNNQPLVMQEMYTLKDGDIITFGATTTLFRSS